STQWSQLPSPTTCGNQAGSYNDFAKSTQGFLAKASTLPLVPQYSAVDSTTPDSNSPYVPFLGNTSMESYERSNCIGCHSKAVAAGQPATGLSSDFVYYLQFEVTP
ncbi:MAG: hypothetical protein OEU26_19725, partial [Candidatus Tectomicrobia bacterium]|nr:hypothetical protein [Candidatus Tectomicrobia bacterium]